MSILDNFEASLERSLPVRGQQTDSGFYMGMFFHHFISIVIDFIKLFKDSKYCQTFRVDMSYLTDSNWFILPASDSFRRPLCFKTV